MEDEMSNVKTTRRSSIVLAPVVHRILHKFQWNDKR